MRQKFKDGTLGLAGEYLRGFHGIWDDPLITVQLKNWPAELADDLLRRSNRRSVVPQIESPEDSLLDLIDAQKAAAKLRDAYEIQKWSPSPVSSISQQKATSTKRILRRKAKLPDTPHLDAVL